MRRRFFVSKFTSGTARMQGDAAHHLARVLRAEAGQLYELSDGREVFLARIESIGRESVDFALVEPVATRPARLHATVLLAVVKFDRFEWALEKGTELGVDVFVPLSAERSDKKLVAAAANRVARWRTILLESAQQARCLRPPELQSVTRPSDGFRAVGNSIGVMLSERDGAPGLRQLLEGKRVAQTAAPDTPTHVCLAVGPEGGWTDAEFAAAASAGFAEASLGERVLRTETAVVSGLAAAHLYFDR